MDLTTGQQVILIVLLLALSAFFSASEVALIGTAAYRRKHLASKGSSGAGVVDRLMKDPQRVIIGILIGNNLVNVGAASIATALAIELTANAAVGVATGVMTLAILTFGEVVPKGIAASAPERAAVLVARPLSAWLFVCTPLVAGYRFLLRGVMHSLGVRGEPRVIQDEEEFKTLVQLGQHEGVLEEEEKQLIHGVLEFGDVMAREIMVPRPDMTCIPNDYSIESGALKMQESEYSRLPIYEGNRDNILGMVTARDVLGALAQGKNKEPVTGIMKEVLLVPETIQLSELLRLMREKRQHLAVLLDEYGSTAGLATMEDVLEEIIGEIYDEYDAQVEPIQWREDGQALVDAKMRIEDVNDALGSTIPTDEGYDTVGGFLFHKLERPGRVGDAVSADGWVFAVERATARRIQRVTAKRTPPSADESELP